MSTTPSYIDILNESSVVFITDLGRTGWNALAGMPGFEAISPTGEIRPFVTRRGAEAWRRAEVNSTFAFYARTAARRAVFA